MLVESETTTAPSLVRKKISGMGFLGGVFAVLLLKIIILVR